MYKMKRKIEKAEISKHIIAWILLVLTFYPLVIMIFKSFKTPEQNLYYPFSLSFPLCFENYYLAWKYVGKYIMNTIIIACGGTIGIIAISALSAYVFARYTFPGKNFLYMSIVSLMMVPGILTLIPSFLLVDNMNMLDTKWAVILPGLRAEIPFGIFLLRSFFEGMPEDLFEAARIDGASTYKVFSKIALPLSRPILATLGILSILFFWNDVTWPSIALQTEEQYTIAIGLKPFTTTYMQITNNLGPVMAGYCIVSIPLLIVFFFASKQFIEGMTSGAIKM